MNDIDAIFADMAARDIDAVYRPVQIPNTEWSHTAECLGYYDPVAPIHKGLICIAFLSRRAAMKVAVRRMEMAAAKRASALRTWPIGEAVVAHEIVSAGLNTASLADYCDTTVQYDWAPAYLEAELSGVTGRTFVHPVLPFGEKFVISNFVQTYNGLASPEMIERGVSLARARRINRFDIYARLLHVDHVWVHHQQALMAAARETLDGAALTIAAQDNRADARMIARQLNIPTAEAERWVAPLPRYDAAGVTLGAGRVLRLDLPAGATTLRLAAPVFPGLMIDAQGGDGGWTEASLYAELEQGGLTIFRADLPCGTANLTLSRASQGTAILHWLQIA